jgi:uncharacterized membrane protein YeaQ/YmgE (transglycosylase-associated protein family)
MLKKGKEYSMHTLADIIVTVGGNRWTFGTNLIVYLIIAAIIGFLAEFLVGWRLPFGFIGAIIAALIGIWLVTQVIQFSISGFNDPTIDGVPLVHAFIGAVIFVALWHLITYPTYRRRRRYYYRRG